MDIIRIGNITIYLARNVCHDLHTFGLVMDIIFIDDIIHSFILVNGYYLY